MLSPDLIRILNGLPCFVQCHERMSIRVVNHMGYVFMCWSVNGQEPQWLQMGSESVGDVIESLAHHRAEADEYRARFAGNRGGGAPAGEQQA
ncbi:MAG TPA: hypothetical protein VF507_02725 [Pyrinomonadaceae bacterium]|jgi:hypothetical protein